MCKYKIELWKVRRLNQPIYDSWGFCLAHYPYEEVEVGETEYYYSDDLVEILQFLKSKRVFYVNLNCYQAGDYNLDNMDLWNNECCLANVYLRDKLLKFHKVDVFRKEFPNYTACGYKIKGTTKSRKIKYNYKNPKHAMNIEKDYSRCILEANEIEDSDYNVPNKDIAKLKKKNFINNSWDLYEEVRSRNSMSWKNQKKRRQWQ